MQAAAPVISIADESRARLESAAWARFAAPTDASELYASWLALLCLRIERTRAALLLLAEPDDSTFAVAAAWPEARRDLQYLGPAAEQVLERRQGLVLPPPAAPANARDLGAQVGYPILQSGRLHGAVVLDIAPGPEPELQRALRQIHWSSAWLVDHFRERELGLRSARLEQAGAVLGALATALQDRRLVPSALAVANELATRLHCDRVSIGVLRGDEIVPVAMSHSASFDARSDLLRALGAAMTEVFDLEGEIVHPAVADGASGLVSVDAARALRAQALCALPLRDDAEIAGAIVFERSTGPAFDTAELALARALAQALGAVFALKQRDDRSLTAHIGQRGRDALSAVFGATHPGLKLLACLGVLFAAIVSLLDAPYRVSAHTVVEGSAQLSIVSPFEGFIAEAFVRAGDTVRAGQAMARLDDRDLKLEATRWAAEREQLLRKFQVALAAQDRSAMGVVAAQVNQAEAQLALASDRLARATLVSPQDSVVVTGDLSQQIGSPAEQGKLLFEVAPLSGYRIIVQVDERDIADLAVGQRGELVLSGLAGENMRFTVRRITSVSTAQDGRNFFRVEAQVERPSPRLRIGMEGIAKVEVGERRLAWIWTHGLLDWARLALWSWLP